MAEEEVVEEGSTEEEAPEEEVAEEGSTAVSYTHLTLPTILLV